MGRDREKGGRGGGEGQREKGRRRRRETLGICGPPASFRTCGLPACVHTCELPASKCACGPPASKCACDPPASCSREDMCGVCRFRVAMLHARSYCVCVCVCLCVWQGTLKWADIPGEANAQKFENLMGRTNRELQAAYLVALTYDVARQSGERGGYEMAFNGTTGSACDAKIKEVSWGCAP